MYICKQLHDMKVVDNRAMVNVCVVDNKYWYIIYILRTYAILTTHCRQTTHCMWLKFLSDKEGGLLN